MQISLALNPLPWVGQRGRSSTRTWTLEPGPMASLWTTLRRESCGQMPGKVVTASLWSLRNPHSSMQKCELLCKWNLVMDMGRHMYNVYIYLIHNPAVGSPMAPGSLCLREQFPNVLTGTHPCKAPLSSLIFKLIWKKMIFSVVFLTALK